MNVILIQLESTSAAYLDEKTTPNLMKLASNGVSFTHHATVFSEQPARDVQHLLLRLHDGPWQQCAG